MSTFVAVELVEAARKGGSLEIEDLLGAVWPDAYRLVYSVLGSRQAAEDAAQEACIVVYRSVASLRSAAAFRVWLYRIVIRAAMEIRRRSALPELRLQTEGTEDETASIDLWRALATLPEHLRTVIVLRYFEDLSSREIASVLRMPDGTVRFHLATARQRLRPLLNENVEQESPAEVGTNAL